MEVEAGGALGIQLPLCVMKINAKIVAIDEIDKRRRRRRKEEEVNK